MRCEIQFLIAVGLVALLGKTSSESFKSKPSDPTYAFKGGSVFLNWSYTSTSNPWSKRWYQADAGGSPIGKLIMTQLGTQSPAVIKDSFIGRVTYVANAGMLVTNVSLSDAGSMKFDVTFENHAALDNTIQLIVTIAPTIVTALANESIVFEKKESRHECVFDARPAPTIKWYLNNIEMNNIRYNINTTTIGNIGDTIRVQSILVINSSMPEDTGVISCVAILPNANISSATNHIVLYEPRDTTFTSNNINHVGGLRQSATFTCSANGNPSIFYQIYKDGNLLKNSTNGVYTLNSVSISDEGIYSCSPINIIGVGPWKQFNFTVHVAPALLSLSDRSIKTVLGSHLALSCIFYGEPTPNITWRKHQSTIPNTAYINTTMLSSNSSFSVVQSLLTFVKVSKSDYGLYECMANNVAGYLAQNISVDVQYAPEFNKSLKQNYTLVEDSQKNESWVCKADGNPEMKINWMVNGKPAINGFNIVEMKKKKQSSNGFEIESMLTMVGINRINAGSLICNVSNSIGNIQSHGMIFIQYPPTAKSVLRGETNVTLNSTVNLVCDVNSLPSPQIHWEKDGEILNSSHYMISEGVTYSSDLIVNMQKNLTILNAKKTDFGTYRCVSVNKIGNLTQQTLLNVLFKAEFMMSLDPVSYIQEGTRKHKLRCIVVGNPEPTISWIYNGTVVQNNNYIQIINRINKTAASTVVDSVLEFKVIKKIYYGNYTCMASSALGSVSSNQLLIVTYEPLILQSSANVVVTNATNTVTLFCEVQSNPSATVYWKVQNQQANGFVYTNQSYVLSKSLDTTSVRTQLMIVNSTRFDNGMYSCVANNSLGIVVHNTTLVVQYAPMNITSLLVEYHRDEDTPFLLSCSFFSNPESIVFWKYNGSLIKDLPSRFNESSFVHEKRIDRAITNSSMQVNALQRQMRGDYECFAENHQGLLGLKTTLIVNYEPTFQSQAASKVILDSKGNTSLSCKVDSSPLSTITWLKDGQVMQNNTKILTTENVQYKDKFKAIVISKLQLNMVNKSDTANYSCKATNKLTTKYQKTRIIIRYSAEITTNFDSHQNLTESSTPLNFTCTVESHPPSTIQWFKDGSPYHHNVTTITVMSSDSKTILQSKLGFPNGIKRKNFGVYICRASNLIGNASKSTDVKVWYGPEFHSNLSGQVNTTKSGNASFECIVEANPSPMLEWHRNGIKLTSNRYVIETETVQATASKVILKSVINMHTVSKSDTAIYKCQTSNIVATKHQNIHLNVQYRPQLLVASSNLTANESNEVSLHCNVDANPAIVDYVWTKDGQRLNHNGQTYAIASVESLSTGTYKCTPQNSIGSGETVTYGLLVRIPPTFTARADCKPNRVTNMMTCSCSGQGVPPPSVFWTKDSNKTTIASAGNFQKSLFSKRIDGRYHCHLRNILAEVVSTSNFFYYITPTSDWQSWGKCNVTCGDGYQTRKRTCNIQICTEHLSESKNCTITCVPPAKQKDKPWAIALYVLIPVCFALLVLLIVWLARTNRRKPRDDAVVIPVNGNLTKPPSVRSVPTRRDIYLPEKSFGSINPAYFVEENELQNQSMDKINTEIKETEVKFEEESLNESSTDRSDEQTQPEEEGLKKSPSLDDTSTTENNKKSNESENENEGYGDADEVDTYLGPDGQTVSYSFYNELSTAL